MCVAVSRGVRFIVIVIVVMIVRMAALVRALVFVGVPVGMRGAILMFQGFYIP
jgi:hypothetical protein